MDQREAMVTAAAIAGRVKFNGVSPLSCEDCGDPIPQRRRELLAGVTTCVDCAELRVGRERLGARR